MGSLTGHIQAGMAYTLLGLRWTYCLLLRFFLCRREVSLGKKNAKRFRSTITFPMSCKPNMPMDALLLGSGITFQIFGEFATAFMDDFGFIMNGQHMTMMFFVVLACFCLVLKHYKLLPIPDLEYATFALALCVQAFVLRGHIVGKSAMEGQVHMYVFYLTLLIAVAFIGEAKYRHNVLISLMRSISITITGSWLVVLGFILFHPFGSAWDQESSVQMKIVMLIFLWLILANMMIATFLGLIAMIRVRNMTPPEVYEALETSCCTNLSNSEMDVEQCQYMLAYSDDDII